MRAKKYREAIHLMGLRGWAWSPPSFRPESLCGKEVFSWRRMITLWKSLISMGKFMALLTLRALLIELRVPPLMK